MAKSGFTGSANPFGSGQPGVAATKSFETLKLPSPPKAVSKPLARLASAVARIPGGSSRGSNSSELFLP